MIRPIIFFLLSVILITSAFPTFDDRIVGGSNAIEGESLHQVSLRSANNYHFCGGSILNNNWILSAAHCLEDRPLSNTLVVVGTLTLNAGGLVHLAQTIIIHPEWNREEIINDIAILETSTSITFTATVQPIQLSSEYVEGGVPAIVTGWGTTTYPGFQPNDLQILRYDTISFEECLSKYADSEMLPFVHETTICSYAVFGHGACHGDSGGPYFVKETNTVIGVVSWGISCARGYPDVYTRVSSYRSWILEYIN